MKNSIVWQIPNTPMWIFKNFFDFVRSGCVYVLKLNRIHCYYAASHSSPDQKLSWSTSIHVSKNTSATVLSHFHCHEQLFNFTDFIYSQTHKIYNFFLSITIKCSSNVLNVSKELNSSIILNIYMQVLKYVITVLFNQVKSLPTYYYFISYTARTTKGEYLIY